MSAIKFTEIHKHYSQGWNRKTIKALNGFSLEVNCGEIFALAGLNGAGKTTAIKILLGLSRADDGSCSLFSQQINQLPASRIGFAPENPDLPDFLTPFELLGHSSRLVGAKSNGEQISALLERLDLIEVAHRQISELSKGNRQRVSLAAAMIHEPELLILDEPSSGLDPVGRSLIKDILRDLNKTGTTIFFSTHILSDLPGFCHRMAVIHQGHNVFMGSCEEFSHNGNLEAFEARFKEVVSKPA